MDTSPRTDFFQVKTSDPVSFSLVSKVNLG
jgi:hypothetical protein